MDRILWYVLLGVNLVLVILNSLALGGVIQTKGDSILGLCMSSILAVVAAMAIFLEEKGHLNND